ncbi:MULTISPECIES: ATP-binding protein [unclassified Polaromonas]|uniref:ATP-binding protein n=1 Tax=unclassified Polaromonas TaxID=2638319 RepID=UPI0018C9649D|nr:MULTISPECIES: ATP-binding protein [unclassified Polaromonas]MBG6071578.1 two-component system osmolarity sensor histidine kinase EnvZ [Polaromonas sp. CG_9.7]MBG6113579.1 two-component system osmolarity sensor histidine kinase EnvZ [Polaromonas sp. CG_9.2]MDH6184523.1 two-component system osmolarity sensor histidine kinase EnvZ [Polaromonas sp. CG_23.6]
MQTSRPSLLETEPAPLEARPRRRINLFWRTFFYLALLLFGSIIAWVQTFRALETGPRAIQSAQQLATLVNTARVALRYTDPIGRGLLIKTLAEEEHVRIMARSPKDAFEPYISDEFGERIANELTRRLGTGTVVAGAMNKKEGLWIGFSIDNQAYWLLTDPSQLGPSRTSTWAIWLVTAAALSMAGAAVIARLINQPLKQLSFAASRMRDGDFDASRLDEQVATSEVREVNIGFNRMAAQLSKIEQDRVVMLAGISHDLRTPLARLRLETEMSVSDPDARQHMVADIAQLDAIIDKFLDYARPEPAHLEPIVLNDVIAQSLYSVADYPDMNVSVSIPENTRVLADKVDLSRVIANLLENSRRYGRSSDTGMAHVDISARISEAWVLLKIRDHGNGVASDVLSRLTNPFFRGDVARTEATGAGLGLAIAEKTVLRMGGLFSLSNTGSGGLAAHIKLRRG